MATQIRDLAQVITDSASWDPEWRALSFLSEDCLAYLVWNTKTQEGVLVDPKQGDQDLYIQEIQKLKSLKILAVIDTHTHADHISSAAQMSVSLGAPLIMHNGAVSKKVNLRVCIDTPIVTQAGILKLLLTPGHTSDSITAIWGPFIFGGDTLLFGDTGRDDLPTGDPTAHYKSLVLIKSYVKADQILLPGHDHKGGRASSWKTQLEINSSLTQKQEEFVSDSEAFKGSSPKLFKESLYENFK